MKRHTHHAEDVFAAIERAVSSERVRLLLVRYRQPSDRRDDLVSEIWQRMYVYLGDDHGNMILRGGTDAIVAYARKTAQSILERERMDEIELHRSADGHPDPAAAERVEQLLRRMRDELADIAVDQRAEAVAAWVGRRTDDDALDKELATLDEVLFRAAEQLDTTSQRRADADRVELYKQRLRRTRDELFEQRPEVAKDPDRRAEAIAAWVGRWPESSRWDYFGLGPIDRERLVTRYFDLVEPKGSERDQTNRLIRQLVHSDLFRPVPLDAIADRATLRLSEWQRVEDGPVPYCCLGCHPYPAGRSAHRAEDWLFYLPWSVGLASIRPRRRPQDHR